MKRRVADALYAVVFPRNRVWRHSYFVWRRLPWRLGEFITTNYSPEPPL